jgi:hypothetical protein
MPKVMLRLKDLTSGEPGVCELPSVEEAVKWLEARPENTEVLGVVFEGITRDDNARMKAAMRPLTEAEQELVQALEDKAADERDKREEAQRKDLEAQQRAAREAAKNASPTRPMELRYRFDTPDLEKTDPLDDREITEDAKKAVMEWVHERMEWVAARDQSIGEAKVMVYPGVVPAKSERVVGGSFVPVAAPPKPG